MTEYVKIGKLVAVHGLKGEMLLRHNLARQTSLKGLPALFIEEKKDSFIPWFVESARSKNEEEIFVKLEGVDSRESAQRLIQKEIWLPSAEFRKFSSRESAAGLLGYTILDRDQPLGEILEVIEQPHQLLCRLEIKGKEVLIPVNENTLQKTDHRKKQLRLSLPDGLLDIYLT